MKATAYTALIAVGALLALGVAATAIRAVLDLLGVPT